MVDHRLRRWHNIDQHWVCCLDDLPLAITVKLSVHSVTRNQVLLSSCHHTRRQHFNVSSPLPSEIPHPTDEHGVCRICQLQAWLVTLPVDGKTSRRWSNLASIFRARLSRLWINAVHLPFIWDVSLSERAPNPRYSVLVDTSTWQCEASYLVPSATRTHLTQQQHYMPAKMRHSPNVVSMLGQRRRRWISIDTTSGECPVFRRHLSNAGLRLTQRCIRWDDITPALYVCLVLLLRCRTNVQSILAKRSRHRENARPSSYQENTRFNAGSVS